MADGTVIAWGENTYDQCTVPSGLGKVKAISAGGYHSLALKEDGTVVAWGWNHFGECNVPEYLKDPDKAHVKAISAGRLHSLALKEDGTVVAWGWNHYGECNVPADLKNAIAIAAGDYYNLALTGSGTVVAWGANQDRQCEIPADLRRSDTPYPVIAIAAGSSHSLALLKDGTVACWGKCRNLPPFINFQKPPRSDPDSPPDVTRIAVDLAGIVMVNSKGSAVLLNMETRKCLELPGFADIKEIAGGLVGSFYNHRLGLKDDGTVVCDGDNTFGECDVPDKIRSR
jgi:alpha-tubulin suppressor-like RCC1 family protein